MTTVSSTKQDILQLLLKQGQATAQALAEQLQMSPQAIRRHLKDLEAEGLIVYEAVHTGMGRPQHLYHLSQAGHHRFPNRHDEFAVNLLDVLTETMGQEQTQAILQKQWERKAAGYRQQLGQGSLAERLSSLVQLRRAEGYMTECYPLEDGVVPERATRFILTEYNCAISQVAQSFPTICDHELEMFAAALEDCRVERTHWIVNGEHRCGYLIQAR